MTNIKNIFFVFVTIAILEIKTAQGCCVPNTCDTIGLCCDCDGNVGQTQGNIDNEYVGLDAKGNNNNEMDKYISVNDNHKSIIVIRYLVFGIIICVLIAIINVGLLILQK